MNYLLDTNVILDGLEDFINSKKNCGVIIPSIVLEELNHIKETRTGEVAFKARRAMRYLFNIKQYGNLNEWIKLQNDISIHVHSGFNDKLNLAYSCNDDIIIGVLSEVNVCFGETILVSSDINILLKAESFGFKTNNHKYEDYYDNFYTGHIEVLVDDNIINEFYSKGSISWLSVLESKPYENQCVTMISSYNPKKQALSITKGNSLTKLKYVDKPIFGNVKGKNRQQKYFIELLMDDDIPIVAVNSQLGTGKSYISTAVGLQKVLEDNIYDKILYIKPMEAMGGKEIGFLPSDKNSKLLGGYSGTIVNILENIFSKREDQYRTLSYADDLIEKGQLQVEAMAFMRGMSYYKTFIIIDEASNISKVDIKNLLGRCGEGSKCCVIGDSGQQDTSKLTPVDNGLHYIIEKFKDNKLFGTIKLDRAVRSEVAQLVVDRL